jgi:hypothetical protein
MPGFGPLFQLQVAGRLCPCLEKSENRSARWAISEINQQCRTVEWYFPSRNNTNRNQNAAMSFLGGLFQQRNNSSTSGGSCKARLILRDSGGDGKPEIFIDPCHNGRSPPPAVVSNNPEDDDDDVAAAAANGSRPMTATSNTALPGYKLNVKLRRVDKVHLDNDNQIVLYARKSQSTQPAKELVRFVPLQPPCHDNGDHQTNDEGAGIPMTSDARNMLVHHFMVIVEWERQRIKDNKYNDDEDDDDDEDDENQPNFLQARAQKAAHFAKREIEMQKTRKDREKRKAKLVAEAGGLKYTAMAMANSGANRSIT